MKFADSTLIIDILRGDSLTQKYLDEKMCTTHICMFEVITGLYIKNVNERQIQSAYKMLSHFIILPLTEESAHTGAKLFAELVKKGREIHTMDCLIAAVAITNNCSSLITRNVKHFGRIKNLVVESY